VVVGVSDPAVHRGADHLRSADDGGRPCGRPPNGDSDHVLPDATVARLGRCGPRPLRLCRERGAHRRPRPSRGSRG
jgi:hypothetical protein